VGEYVKIHIDFKGKRIYNNLKKKEVICQTNFVPINPGGQACGSGLD
jgi:hypothetical protein